jgi:hypothetical protein
LKLKRIVYILFFLLISIITVNGQQNNQRRLIQVSGIITDDSRSPVPHISIISQKLKRGTISELTGIYSLISLPGDTVFVSGLGYKRTTFNVPEDFDGHLYKKDITLISDTISIEGVTILPWKTYEEFKRDVLAHQPVIKPEIQNMYDNLNLIQSTIANTQSYKVSPEAGYRLAMQQNANEFITRNQYPSNNLLNPFAWAKFFSGIKNGLLKNHKSTKSSNSTKPAKVKSNKKTKNKKNNQD